MEVLSFEEALKIAGAIGTKKHLLLGNGFSRACRDDIFAYGKLFERADFKKLSKEAYKAFDVLQTTDFEVVMEALRNAAFLVDLYAGKGDTLVKRLMADAEGLRDVLVTAIAESHPATVGDVEEARYDACGNFLGNFNDYYTLNYDLLLYWALMHDKGLPASKKIDGFHQPETGHEEWVEWDSNEIRQKVHYLHGALHIYEDGPKIKKYTWCNTNLPLTAQIRQALEKNKYPLFVAEGSSYQKESKIIRSSFLGRTFRSFKQIGGSLFIYGWSMSANDLHISDAIIKNNVDHLFVSLHDDPNMPANKQITIEVKRMKVERAKLKPKKPLEVTYFDANSAKVWG